VLTEGAVLRVHRVALALSAAQGGEPEVASSQRALEPWGEVMKPLERPMWSSLMAVTSEEQAASPVWCSIWARAAATVLMAVESEPWPSWTSSAPPT